jgi:hypothetical protein
VREREKERDRERERERERGSERESESERVRERRAVGERACLFSLSSLTQACAQPCLLAQGKRVTLHF